MAPTILITGASGLIGSWVMSHGVDLGLSDSLMPVNRDEFDLLLSGEPSRMVRTRAPELVVHLAWCASRDPLYQTSEANEHWLRSSLELARACRRLGTELWLTGSVVDESSSGGSPYAAAKSELRRTLSKEIDSAQVGWLRPTHVFDPGKRSPQLVAQALNQATLGQAIVLRSPYDAHDFVHASDVGRAILVAVEQRMMGVVSIGAGVARTVGQLVDGLGVKWIPGTPEIPPSSAHSSEVADTQRLRRHHWTPARTLEFFSNFVDEGSITCPK